VRALQCIHCHCFNAFRQDSSEGDHWQSVLQKKVFLRWHFLLALSLQRKQLVFCLMRLWIIVVAIPQNRTVDLYHIWYGHGHTGSSGHSAALNVVQIHQRLHVTHGGALEGWGLTHPEEFIYKLGILHAAAAVSKARSRVQCSLPVLVRLLLNLQGSLNGLLHQLSYAGLILACRGLLSRSTILCAESAFSVHYLGRWRVTVAASFPDS